MSNVQIDQVPKNWVGREVSRAGFYRTLQEQRPQEEDTEVRSAIQAIAL